MNNKTLLIVLIILIGAFSRIIPHPPNFTAIGAMSILGGLYFGKKYLAFIIPFMAMLISDIILGYKVSIIVYFSFLIIVPMGIILRKNYQFLLYLKHLLLLVLFFLLSLIFLFGLSHHPLMEYIIALLT